MSPVADVPINLSDRMVSHALVGVPFCASQAASGTHRLAREPMGWTMFATSLPHAETLFFAAPTHAISAQWFGPSLEGIGRVLRLGRGWDTYDARPISRTSALSALSFLDGFLEATSSPPTVVPLADGGVQFEWHRGGLDVEIAFSPEEEPEMYVADRESGQEWELDPRSSEALEDIRPLLHRLRSN